MKSTETHRGILTRLSNFISRFSRQPDFTCSDCDRWERCGLPPDEPCVVKAAQLERGDWKLRRYARALSRTVGPMGF